MLIFKRDTFCDLSMDSYIRTMFQPYINFFNSPVDFLIGFCYPAVNVVCFSGKSVSRHWRSLDQTVYIYKKINLINNVIINTLPELDRRSAGLPRARL